MVLTIIFHNRSIIAMTLIYCTKLKTLNPLVGGYVYESMNFKEVASENLLHSLHSPTQAGARAQKFGGTYTAGLMIETGSNLR